MSAANEPDPIWGAIPLNRAQRRNLAAEGLRLGDATPDSGSKKRELLWFAGIEPCLDARDFVQGLLVDGSAAVVYGESNAGKTFWATDLALHVAAGWDFAGRRVEHGGVIYCVLEGGAGFRNRVHAWAVRHSLEGQNIPFAALPYQINMLDAEEDIDSLIASINEMRAKIEVPVRLIVIDTLARAISGGNENAPEDMGTLVKNMDRIRAETGACVLFIHHSGKDAAKGARGHSSLRAAVDTEIEVVAEDDGPNKTATVVKQRDLKKGEPFNFTLDVVVVGQNPRAEDVTSCVVVHSGQAAGAAYGIPARLRLHGHKKRAHEILVDLIAEVGEGGFASVPPGVMSVPEKWWRERFMDRAMPGTTDDSKRKGFKRAATELVNAHLVGLEKGRVWLVRAQPVARPPATE